MRNLAARALHVAGATLAVTVFLAAAGCNSRPARAVAPIDYRQTVAYLASPQLEGRGIGTQGLDRAADYIAAEFARIGLKPLPGQATFFQPFDTTFPAGRFRVKNVVGLVPGKRANEYIVIGAHYDHLGRRSLGLFRGQVHPGADDNASGTTAMLALASRFAGGRRLERSLIFAAFTGEESGLRGSFYFVNHCPIPLSQIIAMVNLDMVGRVRPAILATQASAPVLYVAGDGTADAFEDILERADARSPLQLADIGRGGIGPSDQTPFAMKKIPVLFFFGGMHPDYHRPTDTPEKINYDAMERIVDLSADVISQLEKMPPQAYVAAYDTTPLRLGLGWFWNALTTPPTTQGYTSTGPSTQKVAP